jgi:hypothetical protein
VTEQYLSFKNRLIGPDIEGSGFYDSWTPVAHVALVPDGPIPALRLSLALYPPMTIGDTYTSVAGIALALSFATPTLRREYAGALRLPDVYTLTIEGETDLALPLASIQCRRNTTSTTITAVVPSATAAIISEILARDGEDLVIRRGVRFFDGSSMVDEMFRSPLSGIRFDVGARSGSVTLSGSLSAGASISRPRTLRGISYRAMSGGLRRVRCAVDTYLSPGDVALLGGSETMVVAEMTYSITPSSAMMEVSE